MSPLLDINLHPYLLCQNSDGSTPDRAWDLGAVTAALFCCLLFFFFGCPGSLLQDKGFSYWSVWA